MADFETIGSSIWVHESVSVGGNVSIGHNSCIGYGKDSIRNTVIGNDVNIGAFCVISLGAVIQDNVNIDHYCRISSGVDIGKNSKILYGVQIFDNAKIGENCIIGGDIAERTIIERSVTFMGEIAHSYRNPNLDWDTTDEPSPIIKWGSIVGVNALIIGNVSIGPQSYVGAGEIVRSDIPPRKVLYKGKITPLEAWRGFIKVRN